MCISAIRSATASDAPRRCARPSDDAPDTTGTLDAMLLRPLPVLAQLVTSDISLRRLGRAGLARRFFRRAAAVAYPSLAEGFGLNALEALACGAQGVLQKTDIARDGQGVVLEGVEVVAEAGQELQVFTAHGGQLLPLLGLRIIAKSVDEPTGRHQLPSRLRGAAFQW